MKIKEVVFSIVYVVMLIVVVSLFGISYTSGNSMYPTVENGEVLIINRFIEPKHGDIVNIWSDILEKDLCKRVIGLEGDTIEIVDGVVYRNGEELDEPFNEDTSTNMEEFTVGKDEVFVMGDNRNNSTDSRDLGCMPTKNIKGVCICITGIPKGVFVTSILTILVALFASIVIKERRRDRK